MVVRRKRQHPLLLYMFHLLLHASARAFRASSSEEENAPPGKKAANNLCHACSKIRNRAHILLLSSRCCQRKFFCILSMLENLVEKLLLKAIATIPEAHETTRVIHGLLPCCRRAVSKSDFHKATLAWALELAPDNVY